MILIEFIYKNVKKIYYYIARFIIWFITARDCKHCKYNKVSYWNDRVIYGCGKSNMTTTFECMSSLYRKHFERKG